MTMKNESIRLQSTATGSYLQKKGVITFSSKSMLFDDTATKLAEIVTLFLNLQIYGLEQGVFFGT